MSTQCPSAGTPTPTGAGTPQRTPLHGVPSGRYPHDRDPLLHQLPTETDALLEHLKGSVARLALVHRSGTPDVESQMTDDDGFAWVQQSIEDIAATLRGLALRRSE